jgi:hypothetical protein
MKAERSREEKKSRREKRGGSNRSGGSGSNRSGERKKQERRQRGREEIERARSKKERRMEKLAKFLGILAGFSIRSGVSLRTAPNSFAKNSTRIDDVAISQQLFSFFIQGI